VQVGPDARAAAVQALTASCSEEERTRCKNAGMQDLLPKPIKLAMLQARASALGRAPSLVYRLRERSS
jgi:CheY-like chemotaxis protein